MSTEADIVERLRREAKARSTPSLVGGLVTEAADEIIQLRADRDAAREAIHIFLPPGNEAMEDIIWEDQPDDALMTIRIRYGQFKRARTLLATEGKSHD